MIIDSHLHVSFTPNNDWKPLTDKLLYDMKKVGIDQTNIMPHPQFAGTLFPNEKDMIFQAETMKKMTEYAPGKFLPLLYVYPGSPLPFLTEMIDKYILNGPIIGLKFHISMLADDKTADPLYDLLEQHDIPVLYHAWYKTVSKYTFESDPQNIVAMARKHPKLRILMAHLTGCRMRGIQDIKHYPNIWMDTSGSQPEDGYLARALKELGPDRILFGSDYPGRALSAQLGRIYSIDMSEEDREKILYKNAQSFYRKGRTE